jgi:hypothetical protein
MLGDGSDIVRWRNRGGWILAPDGCGRVQELAAEVLELAGAVAGGGEAAPAEGSSVEDGPDEVEAAGFSGQAADDLTRRRVSLKVRRAVPSA